MRCGQDGWEEVDGVDDLFDRNQQLELWELVASGDKGANDLAEYVLDRDGVCDVDMVATPCELNTDWSCYRVWIKPCRRRGRR